MVKEDNKAKKEEKIYQTLQKKYSLPKFDELDKEFDITKTDFNEPTILRDIRKTMIAKIFSVLTFTEMMLNPTNGSMFHMMMTRNMSSSDKEKISKIFEKLGEVEIESFSLDIDYSEKKEAEFIKYCMKTWTQVKPDLNNIIDNLKINWKSIVTKKEKSYFG